MNAVGIDVSKGESTVAVVKPFGEVVKMPFKVMHTTNELEDLTKYILSLDDETHVVMENTGRYHEPIANALCKAGIFVSVVNAKRTHDYGGDTIRRDKTDPLDSLKLGNFCLDKWVKLKKYEPESEKRKTLKLFNRQLSQYLKMKVMLQNNLISLLDQVFPNANAFFTSPARADGSEKWATVASVIDFIAEFPHSECVSKFSEAKFSKKYAKWCKKNGYRFSDKKAIEIYASATKNTTTLAFDEFTKMLVLQAISQLNNLCNTIAVVKNEMTKIASELPEYATVLAMHGVGKTLAPQLIAEIGDIRNFRKRTSLACFAGIELPARLGSPENQSGKYEQKSRHISKQGSGHLRKTLFLVMTCVLISKNSNELTWQFLNKKRAEGKPYKVYMIAGCNKFLRIYYARVRESLGIA